MAQNALWREDFGKKACLHFSYKNILLLKYSKNMKWLPKSWHRPFHPLKAAGRSQIVDLYINTPSSNVYIIYIFDSKYITFNKWWCSMTPVMTVWNHSNCPFLKLYGFVKIWLTSVSPNKNTITAMRHQHQMYMRFPHCDEMKKD